MNWIELNLYEKLVFICSPLLYICLLCDEVSLSWKSGNPEFDVSPPPPPRTPIYIYICFHILDLNLRSYNKIASLFHMCKKEDFSQDYQNWYICGDLVIFMWLRVTDSYIVFSIAWTKCNCIPRTKYVRGILWFSRRYAAAAASASASADTSSFSR